MFKLKEEANGKSAYENAIELKEKALNLKNLITEIKAIEVGINSSQAPKTNYDIALVCDFESIEDLNAYQIHPDHKAFGEYISQLRTERACIDYEYEIEKLLIES